MEGQPSTQITATMGYTTTPEHETAQSRISTLIEEIGEQLNAINSTDDVNDIITEQDKSDFISKQAELIVNYEVREQHDKRDSYIAKLEADLKKSKSQEAYYSGLWMKERINNDNLKSALKSLTAVLNED